MMYGKSKEDGDGQCSTGWETHLMGAKDESSLL